MLDYGIVGNCVTAALVKKNCSVDWLCFPHFGSPSVFGKILDTKKGGSLEIKNVSRFKIEQRYIEHTAILETLFTSKDNKTKFVVYDFFPRYKLLMKQKASKLIKRNELIRIIKPLKGKPILKLLYDPKPNYALGDTPVIVKEDDLLRCKAGDATFSLVSNIDSDAILNQKRFVLNQTKYIVFGGGDLKADVFNVKRCTRLMAVTKKYWKAWVKTLVLPEKHQEIIIRSAITLKLLTYVKTGAIVAAATTSIPEEVGSERNWDYRYCWVRDASLCVDALKKIGRDYEAKSLINFIMGNVQKDDFIQIMYGINGETSLKEKTLDHLEGFKGSKPVRIGNGAYNQIQHDIYGVILDIIYLYYVYYEYEKKLSRKYWRFVIYLVNQIKFTWTRPDSGIWEFREKLRHYTYSKFMCYVGVDRAIKIAQHYNKEERLHEWIELRDEIRESILRNAYDPDKKAFVMYYGGKELDAALLQMSYHEFLHFDDPRLIGTIEAIYRELRRDYLVKRYDAPDDFGKSKSSFTICSFWLVDALFSIGEEKKARDIFDKLITHANHLGLFSEDIDISTKRLIGNFPQAYTHIALINSSILLSEWSTKRKRVDVPYLPKKKQWF